MRFGGGLDDKVRESAAGPGPSALCGTAAVEQGGSSRRSVISQPSDEGTEMQPIKDAATDFLSHRRVAVTGVSREAGSHGSNAVYRRLRDRGYEVFAVNPNTEQVEGDPAYPNLTAIPGGVQAVVIGTRPDHAQATL